MQAELVKNLKQFAETHGITTDIDKFLANLPAGDFVVLSSAIGSNDSAAIVDLLNSYNATKMESYNYFKCFCHIPRHITCVYFSQVMKYPMSFLHRFYIFECVII
jgi:predicted lipase